MTSLLKNFHYVKIGNEKGDFTGNNFINGLSGIWPGKY